MCPNTVYVSTKNRIAWIAVITRSQKVKRQGLTPFLHCTLDPLIILCISHDAMCRGNRVSLAEAYLYFVVFASISQLTHQRSPKLSPKLFPRQIAINKSDPECSLFIDPPSLSLLSNQFKL